MDKHKISNSIHTETTVNIHDAAVIVYFKGDLALCKLKGLTQLLRTQEPNDTFTGNLHLPSNYYEHT